MPASLYRRGTARPAADLTARRRFAPGDSRGGKRPRRFFARLAPIATSTAETAVTPDLTTAAPDPRGPDPSQAPVHAALAEITRLRDALQASERARTVAESELARLKARDQLARQDAKAASRARNEWLSVFGHELRNPLNALVTSAEVLRAAPPGGPIAESARGVVMRQTRKLAAQIDALMQAGQAMADDIVLDLQPLELRDAVQAGIATARPLAAERGSHLELRADAPVWVQADPARIAQVMAHLLGNGLRHTPAGSTVTVELRRDAGTAVVTVRDTGPGIDADLLPRIFEPFARRGRERGSGGLGVGLAMVKRLTELQGGSIVARSSPGGSAFEWRLPARD